MPNCLQRTLEVCISLYQNLHNIIYLSLHIHIQKCGFELVAAHFCPKLYEQKNILKTYLRDVLKVSFSHLDTSY